MVLKDFNFILLECLLKSRLKLQLKSQKKLKFFKIFLKFINYFSKCNNVNNFLFKLCQ